MLLPASLKCAGAVSKREMRIRELLDIENHMHQKLGVVIELFKAPVERDSSMLSGAAARQIFQNVDNLCELSQAVAQTLHDRFIEYDSETTCISDVYEPFVSLCATSPPSPPPLGRGGWQGGLCLWYWIRDALSINGRAAICLWVSKHPV